MRRESRLFFWQARTPVAYMKIRVSQLVILSGFGISFSIFVAKSIEKLKASLC
jgi:hypothetical protein